MENQITQTAPESSPFKKAILTLAALLVVGGVGATMYLNMGASPAKGDPNEPPPSLSTAGGLKGAFVESSQGFLEYEDADLAEFAKIKLDLSTRYGTPGAVKENGTINYMTVNADNLTMADFVKNNDPMVKGNRALFIVYSAGQGGLSKGFHTYPAGPFGTATTETKKDDLSKIKLARNSGVIMISRVKGENYGVLDPSVAPTSSSFPSPLLLDNESGWILVSGNGKLADLIGTSKDRVISAWGLKDPVTFEKVDMNTYAFSTYHVAWLNLLPKSTATDTVAPKITSVAPKFATQGDKDVSIALYGSDLVGGKVEFNPAADFVNFKNQTTMETQGKVVGIKFLADISDTATPGLKEIKVTTTNGSVVDKSFEVKAKPAVNPLIGQTVLAHYNFPGTLATVQWFEAKVTAVKDSRYSYTFVNKIVSSIDGKAFDIDPAVTPGASIVDDFETNIAVPADAPYLEGEKDLYIIVKYKTTSGYWNARLNSKNTDGTYNITYLNDGNTDVVPLTKMYKPLGEKINLGPEKVGTNKASAPKITNLRLKEGVSGELVTFLIEGKNLGTVTTLSLGGLEIGGAPLVSVADDQIQVKFIINTNIPLGPQDLAVTSPAGSDKATFNIKKKVPLIITTGLGDYFKPLLAPTITKLSVNEGSRDKQVVLEIEGTNLDSVTMLTLGGVDSAAPVSTAEKKAQFKFDINSNIKDGPQNLVITNPYGSSTPVTFTIKAAPSTALAVTSKTATPNSLLAGALSALVIEGSNLSGATLTGSDLVFTIVKNLENLLTVNVTVTAGATPGTRDITITNAGGTYVWKDAITITAAPDENAGWNAQFTE